MRAPKDREKRELRKNKTWTRTKKKKNCIPRGSYRVHITFFERLNRSLGYWNYMSSRLTLVASKIWTTTKQKNDKYDTNIWTYKKKKEKKRRRNAGQCDSMEWPIILHSIFHCFMLCPFACYRTWIIMRKTRSGVFYCCLYSCLLSIVTEEFRVRNIHTKLIQKKNHANAKQATAE